MSNLTSLQPETALSLRGIGKVYRLYQKPMYRVLDLLGLCPPGPGYYHEFPALSGIDLDVPKGQKLAIIGRNGAGKSTLLKIITQTLRPTTGTLNVNGNVSALLQIGTGFHPDFTGRQNVYASFAHMGVTGRRADELFDEVVAFSELHEYIDQPVKTYSTGMGARLMFSAATVLQPDILVIDEILGVGDAYFAHKSFDRMRRMCTDHGTTLLLVTHDVYTALNLCDRFVWIDKGQVKMDADGKSTINAYEASIKEQEEEHLRQRSAQVGKAIHSENIVRVRLASKTGFALPAPLAISRMTINSVEGDGINMDVATGSPDWHLLPESNLDAPTTIAERSCRCLSTYGSIFHKAEWSVTLPKGFLPQRFSVEYLYKGHQTVAVSVMNKGGAPIISGELATSSEWTNISLDRNSTALVTDATGGVYGNARMTIESIELLDGSSMPCRVFKRGESAVVRVVIRVRDGAVPRNPTFVLAIHRSGVAYAARVVEDALELPAQGDLFEVKVHLDSPALGAGQYYLSASLFEPNYFHTPNPVFFTINPRVYCTMQRALEFVIDPIHPVDTITTAFPPAKITVSAAASADVSITPSATRPTA